MSMTLKEYAGVDSYLRDSVTHKEIEWTKYMRHVIEKLGVEDILPYIPFNLSYLQKAYKRDPRLNNTSLSEWDKAADKLLPLLRCNGITCVSLSERVCILKETAMLLLEEKEQK